MKNNKILNKKINQILNIKETIQIDLNNLFKIVLRQNNILINRNYFKKKNRIINCKIN